MKKLLLLPILLLSTNAYCEVYEKVSPKVFRVTTENVQELNIDYLKQQLLEIQARTDKEKEPILQQIAEAKKAGVQ